MSTILIVAGMLAVVCVSVISPANGIGMLIARSGALALLGGIIARIFAATLD